MLVQKTSIWQNKDFLKIWFGESVSQIGNQIAEFILPLLAVLYFHPDPFQIGLLSTLGFLPFLLFSLFAGVWVDRLPRRPVLIVSNLVSALILATIPIAAVFNMLTIEQLYLVGFLTGVAAVFYQVAYFAYLPSLVIPEHLPEANSKMELSYSIAIVSGPGLAGLLTQVISLPATILVDVFSFLVSTINLVWVKQTEARSEKNQEDKNIWQAIWVGLGLIIKNPLLRAISGCTGTTVFFRVAIGSQLTLYAVQNLGIEPGIWGIMRAIGSFGPLVGAILTPYLTKKLGVGRTLIWVKLIGDLAYLLIPLAFGPVWLIIAMLVVSSFLSSSIIPMYNINATTLQQKIIPVELKGRVSASNRFLSWSSIPVGTLLGGICGNYIGLQPTLLIGAVGVSLSFLWLYFSPVRTLKNFTSLKQEIE